MALTGAGPLTHQWNKDGAPLAGATEPTLTLSNVTAVTAGNYTVTLTNAVGTTTSMPP